MCCGTESEADGALSRWLGEHGGEASNRYGVDGSVGSRESTDQKSRSRSKFERIYPILHLWDAER